MIKIEITGNTPLEVLSSLNELDMHCMGNRGISDGAGAICAHERSGIKEIAPAVDPMTASAPPVPAFSETAAGNQTAPSGSAPVAGVPVASAPTYTLEEISKAGADLIVDESKRPALQGLLRQFNVAAITHLPPERYGAFATALRGLGANI